MDLQVLFDPKVNLERLAEVLDGLGHAGRFTTVRGWEKNHQARLFEAALPGERHNPLTLDHFVPAAIGPLTEVIHHGKNSLPMFSHFQKRFCRPGPQEAPGEGILWGYNHQANQPFTGPGYFTVYAPATPDALAARDDSGGPPGHANLEKDMHEGEIAIDYRRLATGKVASWPEIIPNSARLGRFVYDGMVDVMRGVSKHVSIGRAWKGGHWMDAWFALCREDVS